MVRLPFVKKKIKLRRLTFFQKISGANIREVKDRLCVYCLQAYFIHDHTRFMVYY